MSAWREMIISDITCSTDLPFQPPVCPETYSRKLDPGAPRFLSIGCKCSTGPREVSPASVVFVFRVLPGQCLKNLNAEDTWDVGPGQGVGILQGPLVPVRKRHGGEEDFKLVAGLSGILHVTRPPVKWPFLFQWARPAGRPTRVAPPRAQSPSPPGACLLLRDSAHNAVA